jgi:hypothetical protein
MISSSMAVPAVSGILIEKKVQHYSNNRLYVYGAGVIGAATCAVLSWTTLRFLAGMGNNFKDVENAALVGSICYGTVGVARIVANKMYSVARQIIGT